MDWNRLGIQSLADNDARVDFDSLIPYLERVNKRVEIPIEDVVRRLHDGLMQAFTIGEDSAIFAMMEMNGTVWLYAAAGIKKDLLEGLKSLEFWYYYRGGERIIIRGRQGWERVLKPYGYERVGLNLQKDLVEWAATKAETTHHPTPR